MKKLSPKQKCLYVNTSNDFKVLEKTKQNPRHLFSNDIEFFLVGVFSFVCARNHCTVRHMAAKHLEKKEKETIAALFRPQGQLS